MAALEISAKFTKESGATATANFLNVPTGLDTSEAAEAVKRYAPMNAGTLKSAVYKQVQDLELNG